jgi:hypothetical protein
MPLALSDEELASDGAAPARTHGPPALSKWSRQMAMNCKERLAQIWADLGRNKRMLNRHNNLFRFGLALLVIGVSLIIIPPYKQYCEYSYSNQYYCSAYEIVAASLDFIERFNGAFTFLATAIIAWFTRTIWSINKEQLRHSRRIERAYVSGGLAVKYETVKTRTIGIKRQGEHYEEITRPEAFIVTIDNHGKTPAFISDIAVEACHENDLPEVPHYKQQLVDINISPETVGLHTLLSLDINQTNGWIVYGRVFYRDIFGDQHSAGFIKKVSGITISAIAPPNKLYTYWN